MKLIKNRQANYHVSQDTVNDFQNAILSSNIYGKIEIADMDIFNHVLLSVLEISKKVRLTRLVLPVCRTVGLLKKRDYFVVLMGCDFDKSIPFFFNRGKKNVYMFDVWPDTYKSVVNFARLYRVDNIFVSSLDSAQKLASMYSKCNFIWIPEATDNAGYKYYLPEEKNIDVLQIGRMHKRYHEQIAAPLSAKGREYLYEKEDGKLIFPTQNEFIEGLARTKISVCFPSSITHPERSGNVETMTLRYLQSMLSKCLVIGKAPSEMIRLFGYNPVIEADMNNPYEQLDKILNNFRDYQLLIDKNFLEASKQTWNNRWENIRTYF